jgi:hypothetical protein
MSTSRWLTWTPNGTEMEEMPDHEPPKPPKVPSGGFEGPVSAPSPIIERPRSASPDARLHERPGDRLRPEKGQSSPLCMGFIDRFIDRSPTPLLSIREFSESAVRIGPTTTIESPHARWYCEALAHNRRRAVLGSGDARREHILAF